MSVVCMDVSGSGSNIKVRQISTLAGIMGIGSAKKKGKRVSGTKKRKKVSGTKRKRR